ncbi:MAG: F0F1 ATP synthase subunit B [Anaerolineales bacterium]|nr:F0F1 ATP synthase subunit B [Anaerolineales bacterium]
MSAWVYKPLIKMLENRKEKIQKGLEDARVAAEARENAEAEAEKIMQAKQAEASELVRQATARAQEVDKDMKAAAEKQIAEMKANARAEIEEERNQLLGEVRGQIAALAMAAAQKLIGETLDEQRQRTLIDEFFSGVRDGKVAVVEPAEGVSAVVTSALPLTESEQKTISEQLLKGQGEVTFKVNPSILGGLVVRVGDKVLDGSVAGQLESMRQNLQ